MHLSIETMQPGGSMHLPPDAGWLRRLQVGFRALRSLEKHADDAVAAHMLNLTMDAGNYARYAQQYAKTDEGKKLLTERPALQLTQDDVTAMSALPAGTLANVLARYYIDNKLNPFRNDIPVRSDGEYLARRYNHLHDLHHLITGYGVDNVGEIELQAFNWGNLGFRASLLILFFAALLRPGGLPPIWTYADKLLAAYRRGRASGDVIVRPHYELYWGWNIDDVRRHFGLVPKDFVRSQQRAASLA